MPRSLPGRGPLPAAPAGKDPFGAIAHGDAPGTSRIIAREQNRASRLEQVDVFRRTSSLIPARAEVRIVQLQ